MRFTKKKKATDTVKENLSQKDVQYPLLQYRSIHDLPEWNFREVKKTGDPRYLYILNDYFTLPEKTIDSKVFDDIFWEYIEAKGIDQNFKLRLELKAKLAILENEELFEGKKNHTKIELTKLKLEDLKVKSEKNVDLKNDAILSKYIGFLIDIKKTTVSQYIGFENLLTAANEQAKKQNGTKQ